MPRKTKSEKIAENEENFEQVKFLLNMINEDNGVPRNIRKIAQESLDLIVNIDNKKNTPIVCASNCISLLEDIAQDLNCPLHSRTQIYQILSLLEQIHDV
ncbi:MAG: hypothetical protein DRO88_09590 [Promethearchaeia archaeon]|nr:MAG: hypothetical protein DRO88_09590 [Candidatus Lokiarchaeia archaeon]